MDPILFGLVGSGWRAAFYLRVARACPGRFRVAGITSRDAAKREALERVWGVRAFASVEDLVMQSRPQFVVTCVPWGVNAGVVAQLAEGGIPVLSETPPAPDIPGLIEINRLASRGARIQVAEQYHLQPHHAARLAVARRGTIGTVSQAQVSVAHGYHGISLIRRLLGVGFERATLSGLRFVSPIVKSPGRSGPPPQEEIVPSSQQLFRLEFEGRLGIYDFTGDQYFSWIRRERVLVRGERGEIVNQEVAYLKDYLTPIRLTFVRHAAGAEGNLEGNYLKGIQLGDEWVYVNPFAPAPLTDEEIAVASCLECMAAYVVTGEPFYPLAEASQDHYLSLMCAQAAEEGQPMRTEVMPWAT
jgi:predicted dehydrogenase